ncbi:Na(+)-translocating NADH-quinone reductase subunit A [bacterium]|nr:Na(+)-translocating NADH-quinone reductase subunit A [bacterium]
MAKAIKIRKGLDLKVKGKPELTISEVSNSSHYSIKPTNFPSLTPKMVVKEGDKVKVGTPIFHDKYRESINFVSPVSGEIKEVVRGAKRKILEVIIKADSEFSYESIDTNGDTKETILKSGLWPCIKQRPLDIVADYNKAPLAIYVSGFDSAPLAPDYEYILKDKKSELQSGFDALAKMTEGKVNVTIESSAKNTSVFSSVTGIDLHTINSKHPAGNVGTQIHQIAPINKGETVWTINAIDVARIGTLMTSGKIDLTRIVALTGSEVKAPSYYKVVIGAKMADLVKEKISTDNVRYISGNLLTGENVGNDGYLGFYENQVTVIPEGDKYKFSFTEGWMAPGFTKLSNTQTFLSSLIPKKAYDIDTNTNGEERAFVLTGQYEKVFPFDIYPVQLLKAVITNDIDKMEKLGIYEVAPEDFALCEFVCSSKINSQQIIRDGLKVIEEECM